MTSPKTTLAHTETSARSDSGNGWERLFGSWVNKQELNVEDDELFVGQF